LSAAEVHELAYLRFSALRVLTHCHHLHFHLLADAVTRVYYDPMRSKNGALLSVYKQKRRKDPSDSIQHFAIHTPHALPMFKDQPSAKKQKLKDRQDPIKSRKPDLPLNGPGHAYGDPRTFLPALILTLMLLVVGC
jgi:hypothetical protein